MPDPVEGCHVTEKQYGSPKYVVRVTVTCVFSRLIWNVLRRIFIMLFDTFIF